MLATCAIAAGATALVIVRPFGWPEAIWAVAGALLLLLTGLLPPSDALRGAAKGSDVYLFLTGMMLLAELARREGLFDWLAAHAATAAHGSARRLFTLVYLVGIVVTVLLSNDATAVVLTPAVAAVARTAGADDKRPYLLICAFIANAASFVLPISNPANLVIYASHLPPLAHWVPTYGLASLAAIAVTYAVLRANQRAALRQPISTAIDIPPLAAGGRVAAVGIAATSILLLAASALDWQLGLPTFAAGAATALAVLLSERQTPWALLAALSWSVLPLVAGLFVLVEAIARTGLLDQLSTLLRTAAQADATATAWGAGAILALVSNLMNNLPAGLIAGTAVQTAQTPPLVTGAVLIGVDLGPNLSVTGSLATILWLTALRREGEHISAWSVLKLGALVMPPALLAALAGLTLSGIVLNARF